MSPLTLVLADKAVLQTWRRANVRTSIRDESVRPRISWLSEIDRQNVKDSPAYDASAMANQAYDETFLTYYGIRWVTK